MREVILPIAGANTINGELVLTVLDQPSALPGAGADRLIWCPVSTATGTCSWNLLAAITSAAEADSICEQLFAVVVDDAAAFFVPEASLLTANLLLAAARGGRALGEVIAWVRGGQLAPAAGLLKSVGELGAVEDLEAFAASSPGEQAAIWGGRAAGDAAAGQPGRAAGPRRASRARVHPGRVPAGRAVRLLECQTWWRRSPSSPTIDRR
ncbi:hypothetical protein ACFWM1_18745 [Nocardia sp. NPDC058379]|uniref:hypothetical protein n=1 Tax=unclassified Nocardia TaxID=2637762 RepID=UPI0036518B05